MGNVLVTGGSGFIGRHLVPLLRRACVVQDWSLPASDVRDSGAVRAAMADAKPDAVIHLAGLLGNVSSENVRELFETNFVGTLNMLEACRHAGVKTFIFASSLTVHGVNDPARPNALASPFRPIHAYGASKAASEFVMQEYSKRFGMTAVALRPTIVLGDTPTPNAVMEFLASLLRGEEAVIYGTGEHEREWVWVEDVADGFRRGLAFGRSAAPGYYQFFLSGNRMAMRDLAQLCADRLGGRVRFEPSSAKAFTLTCETAESDAKLGWRPAAGLPEMIEKLVAIQRSRMERGERTMTS